MSQVRPEWPLEAESQWNIFLKLVGATGLLGAARLALRTAACAAFNLACGHVVEPGLFYVAGSTRVAIRDRIAMEYFFVLSLSLYFFKTQIIFSISPGAEANFVLKRVYFPLKDPNLQNFMTCALLTLETLMIS